jgi:hypothetical protein
MKPLTAALVVLILFACAAFSGSRATTLHKPQPTEVKILSVPAVVPNDVKITSMPPVAPLNVNIKSIPTDDSAPAMVQLTRGIVIANIVLCAVTVGLGGVTVWSTRRQSRDLRRRDRVTMEREINRAAQRNADTAKRLYGRAQEIPRRSRQLYKMASKELPDAMSADIDHLLETQQNAIRTITARSAEIVALDLLNRESKSDEEIIALLWVVDSHELQLLGIRDEITEDLSVIAEQEAQFLERQRELQAFINQGRQ